MGPKKTNVNATTTPSTNNVVNTNNTSSNETETIKTKRGRKSKKELMASLNMTFTKEIVKDQETKKDQETQPVHLNVNELQKLSTEEITQSDPLDFVSSDTPLLYDTLMKNDTEPSQEHNQIIVKNLTTKITDLQPISKKRGRKPKGGKIIQQVLSNETQEEERPNIILHLKCSMKDLQSTNQSNSFVESFSFQTSKTELNNCGMFVSDENMSLNKRPNYISTLENERDFEDDEDETVCKDVHKEINKKLKQLEQNLHINNVGNKKSCCFWDTCEFDNPPIYIPKHFINGTYHVYGCFCSPECGVAYLMNEHIDSSTKFERYHMFNLIYTKIYEYKKNVKPAPNPYYTLEKYYGNLTIQEYRSLLQNERLFLIVDKPLTRILPELHEDNDDFILNNKIIPSNNYHLKSKIQRKHTTKTSIVNEKFGIVNQEL